MFILFIEQSEFMFVSNDCRFGVECLTVSPLAVTLPLMSPSNAIAQISAIYWQSLNMRINKISWTPIDTITFNENGLTKIPPGMAKLTQLSTLSMASNQITYIGATDMSGLMASFKLIDLSSNLIITISAGAFPGL